MASIVPFKGGYRAHVYVKGERDSKTFRTKREAERWAADRERELEQGESRITFGEAAERWLSWKLPQLDNPKDVRTVEQSIRDHVLPELGAMRLMDIPRAKLYEVVKGVADQGKVETAHRLGQRIRQIFEHAFDSGEIPEALLARAAGLSRVLPGRKVKRHMPAVKPEEVPALLKAIDTYPEPVTRIGLLLLAHVFLRTGELLGAQWSELRTDDPVWVIPAERMKAKDEKGEKIPHVVPLSTQVRALLEELRAMTGEGRYMLASSINRDCPISENTMLFALYRLGYRGKMTGHGFRRVASTILNGSRKWHPDSIERQLSHGETNKVRDAYNMAEHLDERRVMMQWYSDYLEAALKK